MTKLTFHGMPAWVGAIVGTTRCSWWDADPALLGWNPSLLHPIDLAMTPAAAIAGQIKSTQVIVDDHATSGGRTTIGPLFPAGTMIGAVWVTPAYLASVGVSAPPPVPPGGNGHSYEYSLVQYLDGEEGNRRFHGFHAQVLQTQGTLSLVEIWNPGTGAGTAPSAGTWWLDLGAAADPGSPPLAPRAPGALFLDAAVISQLAMFEPKLPPYRGGFALPVWPGARGDDLTAAPP